MAAAVKDSSNVSEAYPVTGGDGPNSHANNSTRQKGVVDVAKELLTKAIKQNLDLDICLPCDTFHVADLGCSVGPNTFFSFENILEAVKFDDHTLNDFNMLFKCLPHNGNYYAAGVPGSFYGRLFPKAYIHFFTRHLPLVRKSH
ncbi:hypothetical protein EV2_048184 [Malus domestica]